MVSYLSDSDVKAIREEYNDTPITMEALARKWGIHHRTCENFVNHKTRKEAGGPPNGRKRVIVQVAEEDMKDIIFMYKCGVPLVKIADKFPQYGQYRIGYAIKKYRATLTS